MKLTRKQCAGIRRHVQMIFVGRVRCETGIRFVGDGEADLTANSLLWNDSDLISMADLHRLAGLDILDEAGAIELDLYVYATGRRFPSTPEDGELLENVDARITNDGAIFVRRQEIPPAPWGDCIKC